MPSAPQPDALPADEVVEVFTGDTLEEAMAYAVASLGPDLVVRRARKVRKGVPGLVGKDRYEVLATPGSPPESTDAVGSAFDALLSQAEAKEDPVPVRRTTRPAPSVDAPVPAARAELTPAPAPAPAPTPVVAAPLPPTPVAPPVVEAPAVPVPAPVQAPAAGRSPAAAEAPAAAPATAEAPAAAPAAAAKPRAKAARPRKAPAAKAPRAAKAPATGWSRARLEALGLPAAVLAGLPDEDPTSDLAWAAHLAEAIEAVLPAPAVLSASNPVVVDGYGIEGVIGLLDAATRGLTPGTITVGDQTVPATASELALVVRAAVLSC